MMKARNFTLILFGAVLMLIMGSGQAPIQTAQAAAVQAAMPGIEYWRTGYTVEGALMGSSLPGRVIDPVASFRSYRGVSDTYYYLAAPAGVTWVKAAHVYLLDRTGTFSGTANLTLEIRTMAGSLHQQVSIGSIDIQTLPTGSWHVLALNADIDRQQIDPGDLLAFHVSFQPGPAGDLTVHSIFDVMVSPFLHIFVPLITH
jgi:hypothetical protein